MTIRKKYFYSVTPGSMGLVSVLADLFGLENVNPSYWGAPVFVEFSDGARMSSEDLQAARELLNEDYPDLNLKIDEDFHY